MSIRAAFEEAGDITDRETASKLKQHVYSAGNRRDPLEAYVAFRGRPPKVESLLEASGGLGGRVVALPTKMKIGIRNRLFSVPIYIMLAGSIIDFDAA